MMILNQVTRAFNSRKRRTSSLFRRPKTASTITIDNEVENSKDDFLSLVKKNLTVDDDDDIVSTTSNSSSTIDLTPCSSARCVITTSSKSMERPDSIDSIRIPHVPTLLTALPSDNADNANDITLCAIPSLRRSTSIIDDNDLDDTILLCSHDDDDESDSDFDCDDSSCIFASPPVPFVCVPLNFSHADAFLHSQHSNCDIPNNMLLLNRPPTRVGDWDAHTIESNNPEDEELSDTNPHTGNRSAAEAAGTNTSSSMTMHILADRRHHQALRRRHQARAILSQNVRQLSSTSIRYSNTNNSTDTRTQQRFTSIRNNDGKQQQQQQQHQQQDTEVERQQPPQRQPRVVKWNMIR